MARLNIEEDLFTDQRFLDLVIALGDVDRALGALVRCWRLGQKFWKYSDHGIPKKEWKTQRIRDEIIDVGMAEDLGDFVRVVQSEKHFGWIRERVESGRRGGISAQKVQKSGNLESLDNSSSSARAEPELLQASSLSSLSSPLSSLHSHTLLKDSCTETNDQPTDVGDRSDSSSHPLVGEISNERARGLLARVKPHVVETWLELYPDRAWIMREILKASNWCVENPHKAPKSRVGVFLGGWLERGWDRHRKSLTSQPSHRGIAEILAGDVP